MSAPPAPSSFYDLTADTLQGKPLEMASLKGKVVLVVNTASKCGFTPQYKGLQELHAAYKDRGLVILGFRESYQRDGPVFTPPRAICMTAAHSRPGQ